MSAETELLEVCEYVRDYLVHEKIAANMGATDSNRPPQQVLDRLSAAIAKATGGNHA